METLLLDDGVYVQERYAEIQQEERRLHGHAQQSGRADAAFDGPLDGIKGEQNDGEMLWQPSWTEKQHSVMRETLKHLAEPMCAIVEGLDLGEVQVEGASTQPRVSAQQTASTSAAMNEFSAATQLGLKLFFRLCSSLRERVAWNTNGRMLTVIASKIPSILAHLPPITLSPGIVDGPLGPPNGSGKTVGEDVGTKLSVFQELLEIFGMLLNSEKSTENATADIDRATIAVAYAALALRWGRMRDIMRVLVLLHNEPDLLSVDHVKTLHPFIQDLAHAEVEPLTRLIAPNESSPTGFLVTFGKGDHGKLGHGQCSHASCAEGNCTENKTVPTVIASARDIKFVKVDSLSTHSVAITTNGEVMAWGNGDKYRLGHGTTSKEYSPRIIDSLSLKGKVLDVACGLGHTLALMSNGDLYAWGNGSNGRLGLGDTNDRSNPTKIVIPDLGPVRPQTTSGGCPSSRSGFIRSVICGASHSLALSSNGRVFAWGKNNQGQCGHGHTLDQLTVAEVRMFREELNEQVTNAAGGWEHSLFCSSTGKVYSCGCGYKDSRRTGIPPVLGHGDCEKRLKPTLIQSFVDAREEIVRVACGWDHSFAISSQGMLYTWGSGTNGKLGHGDEESCEVPTMVRGLSGKIVTDAKAGCEHTVAITDSHELWTFGQGDSGRLGLGDTLTRKVPTLVDFFLHSGLQPVAIAVGDKYNLVLAEETNGNHSGHRSPKKPPSPAKMYEHGRVGYSCNTGSLVKAKQHSLVEALKRKRGIVSSIQELTTLCMFADGSQPPAGQNEVIDAITWHIVRLSSDYMTRRMSEDTATCSWTVDNVSLRPYCVDASAEALGAVLELINVTVCQSMPSERSYRLALACLRVLALNLPAMHQQGDNFHASKLLGRIQMVVKGLVCQPYSELDSNPLRCAVTNEASLILKIGFSLFYPTTIDRTKLLQEISSHPEQTSPSMERYLSTVLACICEDGFCAEIVAQCFHLSSSHVCPRRTAAIDEPPCLGTNEVESINDNLKNTLSITFLLRRMLSAYFARSGSFSPDEAFEKKYLQILGVLHAQWFACAMAFTNPQVRSCRKEMICHCCVDELCKYLYDLSDLTLRKLDEEKGKTYHPSGSMIIFLSDVLLPVMRMTSVFVQSPNSLTSEHYRQNLMFVRKLYPVTSTLVQTIGQLETCCQTKRSTVASNIVAVGELNKVSVSLLGALARATICSQRSLSIYQAVLVMLGLDFEKDEATDLPRPVSDLLQCLDDIDPSHRLPDEDDDLRCILETCLDNDEPFQKLCEVVGQECTAQPTRDIARCAVVLSVWCSGVRLNEVTKWCLEGRTGADSEDQSMLCARIMYSSFQTHITDASDNTVDHVCKAFQRTRFLMKFRRINAHEAKISNRASEWAKSVLFLLTITDVSEETLRTLLVVSIRRAKLVRFSLGTFEELLRTVLSPNVKNSIFEELLQCTTCIGSIAGNFQVHDIIKSLGDEVAKAVVSKELSSQAKMCALRVWLWLLQEKSTSLMEEVVTAEFYLSIVQELLHDCSSISMSVTKHDINVSLWPLPKSEYRHQSNVGAKLKGDEDALRLAVSYRSVQAMTFKILAIISRTICSCVGLNHNKPEQETFRAILRFLHQMLQRVIDGLEKMQTILTPIMGKLSQAHDEPHASIQAYLLASPISVATVKPHVSKRMRLPDLSRRVSVQNDSVSMLAVSFWLYFDESAATNLHDSEFMGRTVVAAFGAPSDNVQEVSSAINGTQSLCLSRDDNLNVIVYLLNDANNAPQLGVSFRTKDEHWLSYRADFACACSSWSHILFTIDLDGSNISAFINGDLKGTSSSPQNHRGRLELSTIDSRTLFITGGTIEETFSKELGIISGGSVEPTVCSPRSSAVSSKHLEYLIDDVWVFDTQVDEQTARILFKQGRAIEQVHNEQQLDILSLSTLRLWTELCGVHLPTVVDTLVLLGTESDSVMETLLRGLQLECRRDYLTEAALLYVELLKAVLPLVTPTDLPGSVGKLIECLAMQDRDAFRTSLRDTTQGFYAFSARAGVQSTSTSTAQAAMHSMLRQYGILDNLPIDRSTVPRAAFNAQLVQLLHRLMASSEWRTEIELKLISTFQRSGESVGENDPRREAVFEALACASTIGGFNEVLLGSNKFHLSEFSPAALQPLSSVYLLTPGATTDVILDAITRLDSEALLDSCNSDNPAAEENTDLRTKGCDILVTVALRTRVLLFRAITGALVRDSDTTFRKAILSKPPFLEHLLKISSEGSAAAARRRLGQHFHKLLHLRSAQALMDRFATPKPRQFGQAHLFLQEDLETIASSLVSRFSSHAHPSKISTPSLRLSTAIYSLLDCLSGEVEVDGFSVYAVQHFPTVRLGRVNITANSGLWYYEVHLVTDGLMQIGYVDTEFIGDSVQGQGVGDHTNSWAFDGYRCKKWNVNSFDYGEAWKAGDTVGVLLDTDRMELSYFLNQKFLGIAFTNLPLTATTLLHPAISLNADQRVVFNFGKRDWSVHAKDKPPMREPLYLEGQSLTLPRLVSPLDEQRLRPVILAVDISMTPRNGSTGLDGDYADLNSDMSIDSEEADEEHTLNDDCMVSETSSPVCDELEIYHPSRNRDCYNAALPGSLVDLDSASFFLPSGIDSSSEFIDPQEIVGHTTGNDDGTDNVDDRSDHNSERKIEMVRGLTALGFPRAWATRCANETSFSVNDSAAVSWILEQMEKEATTANVVGVISSRVRPPNDEGSASSPHQRRSFDDMSLLSLGSLNGARRQNWRLSLSPTKDGRPHTEQHMRNPSFSTRASTVPDSPKLQITVVNPFLLGELEDENDDIESDAEDISSHCHDAYGAATSSGKQLILDFECEESKQIDQEDNKTDTTRRVSLPPTRGEDVLPGLLLANSFLSAAYARISIEALLCGDPDSIAESYSAVRCWIKNDGRSLLRLLRVQLGLSTHELPVILSRLSVNTHGTTLYRSVVHLLRHEFTTEDSVNLPLFEVFKREIIRQASHAVRNIRKLKASDDGSEISKKVTTMAMKARWTLWLASAVLEIAKDGAKPSAETSLKSLCSGSFIDTLIKVAASANGVCTPWKYAAYKLIHMLLTLDARYHQTSASSDESLAVLVPLQFFVELFARALHLEQQRQVAFSDQTLIIWAILLEHSTRHAPQLCQSITLNYGVNLMVDQVTASHIAVSWNGETIASTSDTMSSDDESFILALEVLPEDPPESLVVSFLARATPHLIPIKGSFVLRHLAPDTWYRVRLTRIRQIPDVIEGNASSTAIDTQSTTLVQEVRVRTPREPVFELDADACGKNLILSNRNRTVKNITNKKWHTVRASVAFEEGVHHWHVRIDSCVSKNIFIGVCTADACLENYVGSDAYGYGFLANKAVWHNKSKVHSYGEIFKQGDLIQVSLDCNVRTLSFSRNGEFLGVAATNLHVGGTSESSSNVTGCKWYPAFSLYNKDDQLTLIAPAPSSPSSKISLHRPSSQHASVLALVDSARYVAAWMRKEKDCQPESYPVETWYKWKTGDLLWREMGLCDVLELDASPSPTVETFGLAAGDSVFTSRGHCVVLGAHNHHLWYEVTDAIDRGVDGTNISANLGSWSRSTCLEMLRAVDEFPVHHGRRRRQLGSSTDGDGPFPNVTEEDHRYDHGSCPDVEVIAATPAIDSRLITLVDALVAHRGALSPYLLSYADFSSAVVLHDVVEAMTEAFQGTHFSQDSILQRISVLFKLNQHVYRVIRLFLKTSTLSWAHAVCSSGRGRELRLDLIAMATHLASAVGHDIPPTSDSVGLLSFLRSHLFAVQRERLISEALRRSATPTAATSQSDSKSSDLATSDSDATQNEPKEMVRLKIRWSAASLPFWSDSFKSSDDAWMLPTSKEKRVTALFAQISPQLSDMNPRELRRAYTASTETLSVARSVCIVLEASQGKKEEFGGTVETSKSIVGDDFTSRYLRFWDDVFTEIQSPAFPLFTPSTSSDAVVVLDVNSKLLLPEFAGPCNVREEEALLWFFQVGEMLGIVWRSRTVVPLQFISPCFWRDLADIDRLPPPSVDRLASARFMAIQAIRDGLTSVIPLECLQLSTPQSLVARLSISDVFLIDKLRRHAVYDRDAIHHVDFWRVVQGFSSLERCLLMQFLSGKSWRWPLTPDNYRYEDPIDAWKRQLVLQASDDPPFILQLAGPLADATDHPDACFPVVHVIHAHSSRLHLPAYSNAMVLRQKLLLAIANLPSI